jgi:hypothetical protein
VHRKIIFSYFIPLEDFIERGAQIVGILEWYLLLQISTLSAH